MLTRLDGQSVALALAFPVGWCERPHGWPGGAVLIDQHSYREQDTDHAEHRCDRAERAHSDDPEPKDKATA